MSQNKKERTLADLDLNSLRTQKQTGGQLTEYPITVNSQQRAAFPIAPRKNPRVKANIFSASGMTMIASSTREAISRGDRSRYF